MEVFLIKTLQLILCFALLILLHEGGHFLFAKLFKVKVEKFCLFFDPWKSWKLFSWRGTDYHIGWLPLGGYVKIAGMIDESMDTEQMKQPVKPWEFRAKPAWQRLLIMVGGVLVNFVLALFIYAMVLFFCGDKYQPIEKMTHGFTYNEAAHKLGFQEGDIPLQADDVVFDRFGKKADKVYREISGATSVTVLRDGHKVNLNLPGDLNLLEMLKSQPPFMDVRHPALIDSVEAGSPAAKAGIKAGDHLTAFNGKSMTTWNAFNLAMYDLQLTIDAYEKNGQTNEVEKRRKVTAVVQHTDGKLDTLAMTLARTETQEGPLYTMGINKHNVLADYPVVTRKYGFFESFPAGAAYGWDVLCGYVRDLQYLFTADGAKSIGSFGTIGNLFPSSWNWQAFWELTAFISLMLAFVNILPIPALDGGHVLFLLFEVITRRRPSDKFMERAQMVGMVLLLALMAWAIFNDMLRFVF